MIVTDDLIPRPKVVRERLASTLRETRLLRRLLRLSIAAVQERQQALATLDRQPEADRPEEACHA
jgi:hypothetical protein